MSFTEMSIVLGLTPRQRIKMRRYIIQKMRGGEDERSQE